MRELIAFCFDESFYPTLLGTLHPAERFSPTSAQLDMMVRFPSLLNISYESSPLYEMLMLEHGVRFKKCKNCGRYFILKGNYKTDYCDRIPEGESKDCQTIASLKN